VVSVFTGLVHSTGTLASGSDSRLRIETPLAHELEAGGSVAVNGACLTVAALDDGGFEADVMPETLRRTALGGLSPGDRVNLELPLRAGEPLGGHLVQGHVDDTGTIESVDDEGGARVLRVAAPPELLRYVVEKGSIAVDGVSLTVAEVDEGGFTVSLIPETLERTTLGDACGGRRVNLEVDLLAKYVEKLKVPT
jgi:riboflavin synthase